MNEFDVKWQTCVRRARETQPRPPETAPFGFAARVVALAKPECVGAGLFWPELTWRAFGAVAVLLAVCAAMELPYVRDTKPMDPGIENTVAQLVWSL
jgi:hypothetical protein